MENTRFSSSDQHLPKKHANVKHNNWLVVSTPQSKKEKNTGDHYPKYGGTKHILFRTTLSLSLSMKVCAIEVCAHYTVSGPMLPRRTPFFLPKPSSSEDPAADVHHFDPPELQHRQ